MVPAGKTDKVLFLCWPLPGKHDMIPPIDKKIIPGFCKENFIERLVYTGLNHDFTIGLENRFD